MFLEASIGIMAIVVSLTCFGLIPWAAAMYVKVAKMQVSLETVAKICDKLEHTSTDHEHRITMLELE